MSYYMGDFYGSGSYYRGDPFWGFLGRVAKGVFKAATGFGGGGAPRMAGPAAGAASTAVEKVYKQVGGGVMTAARATGRMIVKHPVLSAAGAAGALGVLGTAGVESMMGGGGGAPRGFHRCKSKHGCKSGEFVRNRHMNPCNPRALRRAIRRATRFTKLAMKTIHLVHPKKKGRFGGFRKRKRAA